MEPRVVAAGHGWQWIVDGFGLFRKNPLIWIVLFLIYFFIIILLSVVPFIGPLINSLLGPVFSAGFMLACRDLARGEDLEIAHLFAGFRHNTAQLITVGGLYLVGTIVIVGAAMLLGGGSAGWSMMFQSMPMGSVSHTEATMVASQGTLLVLFVMLLFIVPLLMAYWFAPVLVVMNDMKALEAMKLSFRACLRNIAPFLVYGVISLVLIMAAVIPFGLGMLVAVPVLTASIYTAYRDIFPQQVVETKPIVVMQKF